MAGYKAGRAGAYAHLLKNTVDMDTPAKMKTLEYYDEVNFAEQITVHVYMTRGFSDNTCPRTTSYIVYTMNKIEEIKKKIRDLKLKQKMTTGRLEWNDRCV